MQNNEKKEKRKFLGYRRRCNTNDNIQANIKHVTTTKTTKHMHHKTFHRNGA